MFSKLVDRNNTSFPKELYETIKSMEIDKTDILRYHQRIIVDYLIKYNVRGVLAYHKMGSGKTIVAVSSCVELLKADYNVMFLASKSLHNNFKDDIRKYHSLANDFSQMYPDVEEFISNINFISLNASNMITQVKNKSSDSLIQTENKVYNLEGSFIVIDEAHNFFNSISNESKNALELYDMILRTKNVKLLFLTGSPIVNHPFEVALCYNMLAGRIQNKTLFGNHYGTFVEYYTKELADGTTIINHSDKFSDRIFGLTSYFGADSEEQRALFPKEYMMVKHLIHMSIEQYGIYVSTREQELKEASRSSGSKPSTKFGKPQGMSSSYRVNSRQISNVLYPNNAIDIRKTGSSMHITRFPDKLTKENLTTELAIWSPKILQVLKNIALHTTDNILSEFKLTDSELNFLIKKRQKNEPGWIPGVGNGFLYSQFLESGVIFVGKALEAYGFVHIESTEDIYKYMNKKDKKGSYVIISGEMDVETRSELIKAYNSPENMLGQIITMLLVTSTGAEGLDLKHGRHGHILEPYWNYSRIAQVIARLVRAGSHILLPEEERTVQYYIYLSTYPKNIIKNEETKEDVNYSLYKSEKTTDQSLYEKSIQNQQMIESFYKVIIESSIDCMIHYKEKEGIECRLCAPTGKQLWYVGQIGLDLPSPCEKLIEKKIIAHSIICDEEEYMYHVKDNKIHIFKLDPTVNAYKEIFADNIHYFDLIEAIEKKL